VKGSNHNFTLFRSWPAEGGGQTGGEMPRQLGIEDPGAIDHPEKSEGEQWKPLRRGWCLGDEAFRAKMLGQKGPWLGKNRAGPLRQQSAQAKAERIVAEELERAGWQARELATRAKNATSQGKAIKWNGMGWAWRTGIAPGLFRFSPVQFRRLQAGSWHRE
jgi:hypothetical protein